jgi:hypothetical protein
MPGPEQLRVLPELLLLLAMVAPLLPVAAVAVVAVAVGPEVVAPVEPPMMMPPQQTPSGAQGNPPQLAVLVHCWGSSQKPPSVALQVIPVASSQQPLWHCEAAVHAWQ